MKRRLDICRKCDKMERCPQNEGVTGKKYYYCGATMIKLRWGIFGLAEPSTTTQGWSNKSVPERCEFYAEHFVRSCNEKGF